MSRLKKISITASGIFLLALSVGVLAPKETFARKFFGAEVVGYTPCAFGVKIEIVDYYFFWIRTGSGLGETVPC